MATRNVVLSQHQHQLVEALVESGRFQNASEVLREEGLRLLRVGSRRGGQVGSPEASRRARLVGDSESRHYDEVGDESLDDFVEQLGVRAAKTSSAG